MSMKYWKNVFLCGTSDSDAYKIHEERNEFSKKNEDFTVMEFKKKKNVIAFKQATPKMQGLERNRKIF